MFHASEGATGALTRPAGSFSALHADVIPLDAMRSTGAAYPAEDLDVPAFLRKRSDVM